ncbi:amidohydrolase family protein [Hyphomonas sp. WL0036]|uniref:amidohydrolase family protein n=1 Tax=Hyphomonas sediminis TaxID=2866160 RepID=UPI001C813500|nr:amidohydrolase family protein [Hyphomonas sediminis]MBY9066841.1 amidohydrolase family protein [Hyphomonas sediminis]
MIRSLILGLAALGLSAIATAQPVAIIGEKVWTGTAQGTLTNGVVVVEDGHIVSVGTGAAPAGMPQVKAKWVTPGLISAFSRTGITEVPGEKSANDTGAGGSPFSAALNAADGFNPDATPIAVTRLEGFTRIAVAPDARAKLFGGQGFLADTSGLPGSIFKERAFAYLVLGERGASLSGGSRPAAWTVLRGAFDDVRFFTARYMTHNDGNVLTRMDAQAFMPAVRGEQLMLIEASRASDLEAIMDFKQENPMLKIAILGADEGWRVADRLAAMKIPVIVDAFSNLPSSFSQLAATSENAARLSEAGVTVAIVNLNDSSHQARLAAQVAGNAVANGLPFDDAMKALTTAPAEIFGMSGLGALAPGARADVVAWDGDPLEVTSAPIAVFIDGVSEPMESRQTKLRDRYMDLDHSDKPFAYRR